MTLEDRLADLFATETAHLPATGPGLNATLQTVGDKEQPRRLRAVLVTSVVVAVVSAAVVTLLVLANRSSSTPSKVVSSTIDTESRTASSIATTTLASTATIGQGGGWRLLPADPRGTSYDSEVVWTGKEAIAFGGRDKTNQLHIDGAAYDPVQNSWRRIARAPDAGLRVNPLLVWTGRVVLVIGGDSPDGTTLAAGTSSYDPLNDTWQILASPPDGSINSNSPWVWTGTTLLVWPSDTARPTTATTATIAIAPMVYDPSTNKWQALPAPPIEHRQDAASVWTGTEWIMWGGRNGGTELADGAAFTPGTATWRALAPSPLAARHSRAVWTGNEMIVAAGAAAGAAGSNSGTFAFADGAAYDPRTDTWRAIAPGPAHPGFAPVWTGRVLLSFFKRFEYSYDPTMDRWTQGPDNGQAGVTNFPVWTGTQALLLGGTDPVGGAAYTPPP